MSNVVQSAFGWNTGTSSGTAPVSLSNVTAGNSIVVTFNAPGVSGKPVVSDPNLILASENYDTTTGNYLAVWYLNHAAAGGYTVSVAAGNYVNSTYLAVYETVPLTAAPVVAVKNTVLQATGVAGEALDASLPAQPVNSVAFALLTQSHPAYSDGSLALPVDWTVDKTVTNASTSYQFTGLAHGDFAAGTAIDATWTATINSSSTPTCDVLTVALEVVSSTPAPIKSQTPTVLQSTVYNCGFGSNPVLTLNNVTQGNTLVLIGLPLFHSGNDYWHGFTDSADTWPAPIIEVPSSTTGARNNGLQVWVLTNAAAGTHTVSVDNSNYIAGDLILLELPPSSGVDVAPYTISGGYSNTASTASQAATTGAQADFALSLFSYCDSNNTTVSSQTVPPNGSGWETVLNFPAEFQTYNQSAYQIASIDAVPANTPLSSSWTFTAGNYYTELVTAILTFKAATTTVPDTPKRLAAWTSNTYNGVISDYATSMVSPAHDVTAGALLVVMWQDAGGGSGYTVADTAANTWSAPQQQLAATGGYGDSWFSYCLSSKAQTGNVITVTCGNGAYLSAFEGAAYDAGGGTWAADGAPNLFTTAYSTPLAASTSSTGPSVIVLGASEYYSGSANFTLTGALTAQATQPAGATVGSSAIFADWIANAGANNALVNLSDDSGGYGGRINGALVAFKLTGTHVPIVSNALASALAAGATLSAALTATSAASNALAAVLTASSSVNASLVIGHAFVTTMQAGASIASPITKAVPLGTALVAEATIVSIEPTITKPLATATDAVTTMLATATVDRALSGALLAASTIQAKVSLGIGMTQAFQASSSLSATITKADPLSTSLTAVSSLNAALSIDQRLSTAISADSSLSANLYSQSSSAQSLHASSALSANLSVGKGLASAITTSSALADSLSTDRRLSTALRASASVAPALADDKRLASALAGGSACAATLGVTHLLASALDSASALDATLGVNHALSTSLRAGVALTANLAATKGFAASLSSTSSLSAEPTVARALQTALVVTTSLNAGESQAERLQARLSVSTALAASLSKEVPLACSLVSTSTLTGSPVEAFGLSTALTQSSSTAAELGVGKQLETSLSADSTSTAAVSVDVRLAAELQTDSALGAHATDIQFVALQTNLQASSSISANAQLTQPAALPPEQVRIYEPGNHLGSSLYAPNRTAIFDAPKRTGAYTNTPVRDVILESRIRTLAS